MLIAVKFGLQCSLVYRSITSETLSIKLHNKKSASVIISAFNVHQTVHLLSLPNMLLMNCITFVFIIQAMNSGFLDISISHILIRVIIKSNLISILKVCHKNSLNYLSTAI